MMCSTLSVLPQHPGPLVDMGTMNGCRKGRSVPSVNGSLRLIGKMEAAVVEYKNLKFLITERPSESSMDAFIGEVLRYDAKCVVRVGGIGYKTDRLVDQGVQVLDLPFPDGTAPPLDIILSWCHMLRMQRLHHSTACVAVHCAAGLGRAPVLVAIALIELGMSYDDAVLLIRQKRHGAINTKQLDFLAKYRPKSRLSRKNKSCLIM